MEVRHGVLCRDVTGETNDCPGEDCVLCSGEACAFCSAGLYTDFGRPHCDHDVITRHLEPVSIEKQP